MKNTSFAKKLAAVLMVASMLTAMLPASSVYASAAEYKVYKDDMTIHWLDHDWTHDEFQSYWEGIYNYFGEDVMIAKVEAYTNSPHSTEWVKGGISFFADCWFQLHGYGRNGMKGNCYKYTIGIGWCDAEGWRCSFAGLVTKRQ